MLDTAMIISALITLLGTVFTGSIGYLIARMSKLQKLSQSTHDLVNNNMEIALLVNVLAQERLAMLTGSVEDVAALEKSRKLLDQHRAKQAISDSR